MKKSKLKIMIFGLLILIIFLSGYRYYLYLKEDNFSGKNYYAVKAIHDQNNNETYSFAVIGSIKNSLDVFDDHIVQELNQNQDLKFVISVGDAVIDGGEGKYFKINKSFMKLDMPIYLGVGSNEVADGGEMRFYDHYGPLYNAFNVNQDLLVFLDSTGSADFQLQLDWFKEQLTDKKYNNIFVFMDGERVVNNLTGKDNISFINEVESLATNFHVKAVFLKGDLQFTITEKNSVMYYATGGAGGTLIEEENEQYHYLVVQVAGNQIKVMEVQTGPQNKNHIIMMVYSYFALIHSFIYIHFWNILTIFFIGLILLLIFHLKVTKEVDYYPDFTVPVTKINSEKKFRVAMFTNNYLPFVGGVPISIERLKGKLIEQGHEVIVFAPRYRHYTKHEKDVFRCSLLFYRHTEKINYAIANIFSSKINRVFEQGNFDIIHCHHPFWLGKKGQHLGLKYKLPVVFTYHTRLELYAHYLPFMRNFFKNILSHRMIKRFAQNCDGIISPTDSTNEYLSNIGVSRPKITIPTGLDLNLFNNVNNQAITELRQQYCSNNRVLLCTVSRLEREKNLYFLIDGLHEAKQKSNQDFICLIIGSGSEEKELKTYVREKNMQDEIIFVGRVPNNEIVNYYTASDLFVFASKSETQGMVLTEAMICGCPIICLRSSGTDDLVIDGLNGYKTIEQVDIWQERLTYLLENSDIRSKMSRQAVEFSKKYSLENMVNEVELFYHKVSSDYLHTKQRM